MRLEVFKIVFGVASLTAATSGLASTDMPVPGARSFTCPIGGAKFEQLVDYPHFPLVQFPDASHLGDEFIDVQIPECPGNKLPILPDYSVELPGGDRLEYHDYTTRELQQLPALLAGADWKSLAAFSRHQRAYWLATKLGRPANDRIQLLVRAQWATSANSAVHRLALEQLVRDLPGLIDEAKLKSEDAIAGSFLHINALRELGRFEEAGAALEELERGGIKLLGPNDPDAMFEPGDYGKMMRAVIDAGDDDRFAIDLLTDSFARRVCGGGDFARYLGTHAPGACAARKKRHEEREALFERAQALEVDSAALEKRCAELPAGNSDEALVYACRSLVHKRDWAEGQKLADGDPVALAAMCETTDERRRTTVQTSACSNYDIYRNLVATALVTKLDERSYTTLCSDEQRAAFIFGCDQAYGYRAETAARELLRDRSALKPKCMGKEGKEAFSLELACGALNAKNPPYWLSEEPPVVSGDPMSRAAFPYVEAALQKEIERANR